MLGLKCSNVQLGTVQKNIIDHTSSYNAMYVHIVKCMYDSIFFALLQAVPSLYSRSMLGTSSMQLTCPHCSKQVIFNLLGFKRTVANQGYVKFGFFRTQIVIYIERTVVSDYAADSFILIFYRDQDLICQESFPIFYR